MTFETQKLPYSSFSGPITILAPATWEFDKGMTTVWARLLELTRRGFEPFKTQRDKHVWTGQVYILALVLCRMGMAPPYWEDAALEIVLEERRR